MIDGHRAAHAGMGLAEPPDDAAALHGFPRAVPVTSLHRLSDHRQGWYYHGVDDPDRDPGGRFDLRDPHGTCHTAESLDGALVEKLLRRPTKVVVAERLHELFHSTITVHRSPRSADLTSPAATRWGINAEIHSTLLYRVPRGWAQQLHRAGWRALRHRLRGDSSGQQAGVALFGRRGPHTRAPAGMHTHAAPLDARAAHRLLQARGVEVRPIPAHVPITAPPA